MVERNKDKNVANKAWSDVKSRTQTVSLAASLQVGIEHLLQHVKSDQVV